MKKGLIFLTAFGMLLTLCGCATPDSAPTESTDPVSTSAPAETTQTPSMQQPLSAVYVPLITEQTAAEDGTNIFSFTYQNMSLTLQEPEIADKVIVDFLNRIELTRPEAESILSQAKQDYSSSANFRPYLCQVSYNPTRIDQGILSLFGNFTTYKGGTHPEHSNVSANYDLINGDVLTLAGILQVDADTGDFCKLVLDELALLKDKLFLYPDYENMVNRRFAIDPTQDEDFYFTPTGLCFYFAPYEIAPYSSGTITIEIPYEKLVGILHDSYFPAEKNLSDSSIQVTPFDEEQASQFTQITEAVLNKEGTMLLLHTDNIVHNIRITASANPPQTQQHTVFAAYTLTPGDAIMLQATPEELANLHLTYENSNGVQTSSIVD